ncbi:hypothetical protein [Aequorivita echinoideorum]|uniref:Outer membrane protein beta-barrel domain-containing protein n=1 Tax=Aequorivita echinoideorum TaxID=1549647 RepID=A0ABS5S4S9_9FLAO|nr:hypothetical protein [Aequorivita echinoideorum]MBT0608227.1 hypothetical protein [Aequorivita echinoideorum]
MKKIHLHFNTSFLFLFLFLATSSFSQTENNTLPIQDNSEEEIENEPHRIGTISMGAYLPIAFGDNYVNNGIEVNGGIRFTFKVNTLPNIFVGPYVSFFNGSVEKPLEVGDFNSTANTVVGVIAGYEKQWNDWFFPQGLVLAIPITQIKKIPKNSLIPVLPFG